MYSNKFEYNGHKQPIIINYKIICHTLESINQSINFIYSLKY